MLWPYVLKKKSTSFQIWQRSSHAICKDNLWRSVMRPDPFARKCLMSDKGVVLKIAEIVISEDFFFFFFFFKMVHISINCCITQQQTTAINKLITVPILFLQSAHLAFQSKAYGQQLQWRRPLGTVVSIPYKRPMIGYRKSIEIPGVSLHLDIQLYIHLLADLPRI